MKPRPNPVLQATVNLATETALVRAALSDVEESDGHAHRLAVLGKELTQVRTCVQTDLASFLLTSAYGMLPVHRQHVLPAAQHSCMPSRFYDSGSPDHDVASGVMQLQAQGCVHCLRHWVMLDSAAR